jgi:hypothetical protein
MCVLFCLSGDRSYYERFLLRAVPAESFLDRHLHGHMNAGVVSGIVPRKQESVNFLTWTF